MDIYEIKVTEGTTGVTYIDGKTLVGFKDGYGNYTVVYKDDVGYIYTHSLVESQILSATKTEKDSIELSDKMSIRGMLGQDIKIIEFK